MENHKIKLTITLENGKSMSAELEYNDVLEMKELHGISALDECHEMLYSEIIEESETPSK